MQTFDPSGQSIVAVDNESSLLISLCGIFVDKFFYI
jgi:hypothetical protein